MSSNFAFLQSSQKRRCEKGKNEIALCIFTAPLNVTVKPNALIITHIWLTVSLIDRMSYSMLDPLGIFATNNWDSFLIGD